MSLSTVFLETLIVPLPVADFGRCFPMSPAVAFQLFRQLARRCFVAVCRLPSGVTVFNFVIALRRAASDLWFEPIVCRLCPSLSADCTSRRSAQRLLHVSRFCTDLLTLIRSALFARGASATCFYLSHGTPCFTTGKKDCLTHQGVLRPHAIVNRGARGFGSDADLTIDHSVPVARTASVR